MTNKDASGILKTEAISHLIPEVREALWMGANELEQEPCGDCISRQTAQEKISNLINEMETIFSDIREKMVDDSVCGLCEYDCDHGIDGFANECPGFERDDCFKLKKEYRNEWNDLSGIPSVTPKQSGWIPITYRPATDEEKKDYAERAGYDEEDIDTILNCQLPEDGETVLITDRLGNVEVDTFINDCDGCYFECNCDMEDVRAWMPLPKAYEPQESEGEE